MPKPLSMPAVHDLECSDYRERKDLSVRESVTVHYATAAFSGDRMWLWWVEEILLSMTLCF